MKANELRLGNLVLVKHHFYDDGNKKLIDKIWTVSSVNGLRIDYVENNCKGCPPKTPNPIPLTEEWLVKFGFKGSAKNVKFELCFHSMKLRFHFRYDKLICHLVGVPINLHVYSIHQLQNLYFALTGEELILKP